MPIHADSASDRTIESHIPSTPINKGSTNTNINWNTRVLRTEITAEITPLLSAVKNDVENIPNPENKKQNENIKNPLRVRFRSCSS